MNITLGMYVVRGINGEIDHEATLDKFASDLLKFEAERELEASTIGAAVHALFDRHVGKRMPTPFVVAEALKALNAQPENYKVLSDKVTEFLRTSPEFSISRGKSGGVGRVCDLTE